MDNPLDRIEETFELQLPPQQSLDDYLDSMLPSIRQYSEDLKEVEFYVTEGGKPWLEVRDDPAFQEAVLHFFNENGEYLQAVDGNITRGRWRLLDRTNKMIIEQGGEKDPTRSELYELAFLNPNFFILKKHGDQRRKNRRKYLFMGYEPAVKGLKWLDCVELLFNEYRSQWGLFQYMVILVVIILLAMVLFSIF